MSSKRSRFVRSVLFYSGGLGVLASAATIAQAQEAATQPAAEIETVVITGSHIQRRDYEANSPIVTVDDQFLKNSSTAAIDLDGDSLANAGRAVSNSYRMQPNDQMSDCLSAGRPRACSGLM